MASDIVNVNNAAATGTAGNQNLGDMLVNTGGIGVVATGCQRNIGNRTTIAISTITSKYDARFDDPTYY